jgi:hypothetical protein
MAKLPNEPTDQPDVQRTTDVEPGQLEKAAEIVQPPDQSTPPDIRFSQSLVYFSYTFQICFACFVLYDAVKAARFGGEWREGVLRLILWILYFSALWPLFKIKDLPGWVMKKGLDEFPVLRRKVEAMGVPELVLTDTVPFAVIVVSLAVGCQVWQDDVQRGVKWVEAAVRQGMGFVESLWARDG